MQEQTFKYYHGAVVVITEDGRKTIGTLGTIATSLEMANSIVCDIAREVNGEGQYQAVFSPRSVML